MGVFFVLLLVPIMMQHIVISGHSIDREKKNNQALGFFFLWLTFLVVCRHENIGNDTENYIYYYVNFSLILHRINSNLAPKNVRMN